MGQAVPRRRRPRPACQNAGLAAGPSGAAQKKAGDNPLCAAVAGEGPEGQKAPRPPGCSRRLHGRGGASLLQPGGHPPADAGKFRGLLGAGTLRGGSAAKKGRFGAKRVNKETPGQRDLSFSKTKPGAALFRIPSEIPWKSCKGHPAAVS